MSSFARTLQKRIFKTKFGLGRQTFNPETGQHYKKGTGPIVNNLGDNLGRHYPKHLELSK